jgi:adenylyltransferase/sulfurtransferase
MSDRYQRSSLVEGYKQDNFSKLKVVVIGCGALGNYVALGLTGYGVGEIVLIDPDYIEESNLNRQLVFNNSDVNKAKSTALKERIEERVTEKTLVTDMQMAISSDNIEMAIPEDASIVFLCVDNANTRLLLNDYLVKKKIPFINGGTKSGHFGEVCTVVPGKTPCLRCFMDEDPTRANCSNEKNPSIVANSMLISSFMLVEFQNLFMGREITPPVLKFVSSRKVYVDEVIDEETAKKSEMIFQPVFHMPIKQKKGCICTGK